MIEITRPVATVIFNAALSPVSFTSAASGAWPVR